MKQLLFLLLVTSLQAQVNVARMISGVNYQTGTTYTFVAADTTRVTQFNNASAVAASLPAATTFGFGAGTVVAARDNGAGTVTITCLGGCTINGSTTFTLTTGQSTDIYSDGVNYVANQGGGAGSGLAGCTTPTSGNLTCTSSVATTGGSEGTLTLNYSGLPTPPSTAVAQFAADATGVLNYSPGSNASFAKVYVANASSGLFEITGVNTANSGTGFATVFPPRSEFPNCASLGWNTSVSPAAAQCGDNFISSQPAATYTILTTDENSVLLNTFAGAVTDTLPVPTGTFAAPFVLWVDTNCQSSVTLTAATGSLINGVSSISVPACGWARVWADSNAVDWHSQGYTPPGGVVQIQ